MLLQAATCQPLCCARASFGAACCTPQAKKDQKNTQTNTQNNTQNNTQKRKTTCKTTHKPTHKPTHKTTLHNTTHKTQPPPARQDPAARRKWAADLVRQQAARAAERRRYLARRAPER